MKELTAFSGNRARRFVGLLFAATTIALCACGGDPTAENDALAGEDSNTDGDTLASDEGGTDTADRDDTAADTSSDTPVADDDGNTDVAPIECQPEPATPVIKVTVYNDTNASSKTDLLQTVTGVDLPWAGIPVSLLAPANGSGLTCDEGWYYFSPDGDGTFTDGYRVLSIDAPECTITSHNMATRTPVALAAGTWKMLVLGDSIARIGIKHSAGEKFFFDHIQDYLTGFGDITIENVAVSGSTSDDWLPGTSYFDNYVVPQLADSDVVFVTLGGNDIMDYAADHYNDGLPSLMEGIDETIATVKANLGTIFAEIRAQKPDADIVWLIYPNYADSDKWRAVTGTYADLVASYFQEKMYDIISWAAQIDGLILVDLFTRMTKTELDASLFDELHYNPYGHQILGNELFKVLNGVIVGEGAPTIGGDRKIGVHCD